MCLPAFLAFAQAGSIPSSRRSDIAYETAKPMLETALEAKGLKLGSDVYLRLTKEPAELTAFVADTDGKFQPFRTWPVCSVSGGLGPKLREGDGQAPEGFYAIKPGQMNPSSNYHLSFNLGYPNAFDRANGRTGSFLMVHGNCVSVGCFAMTDTGIEEIWTLMQAAYENGQTSIDVHIFPFPMTAANLKRQQCRILERTGASLDSVRGERPRARHCGTQQGLRGQPNRLRRVRPAGASRRARPEHPDKAPQSAGVCPS